MSKIINNVIATLQQLESNERDMLDCILTYEIELSGYTASQADMDYMVQEICSNRNSANYFLLPY